ncbi:MAG: SIS domain-containing protein [Oscillospiraceae bacterium]|jgi:D-sedoheptulose 7-phosphate isomerase|nr:SIS domain-containing protein [Oscillospiraceae bacterium]
MRAQAFALMEEFYTRNADLSATREPLTQAVQKIIDCYAAGGKVLTAGSGGSAADAEHITAELLKSFRCRRPVSADFRAAFAARFGEDPMLDRLEEGLPALTLCGNFPILTAVLNDIGHETAFAQTALSLARPGDVLIAISTSGNSQMLCNAIRVAAVRGAFCVALTGRDGGKMRALADIAVVAPAEETYRIQELHMMLYHLLCAAVEAEFFAE